MVLEEEHKKKQRYESCVKMKNQFAGLNSVISIVIRDALFDGLLIGLHQFSNWFSLVISASV